jgi:hypothetical protein
LQKYENNLEGFEQVTKNVEVANCPLTQSMFLGGWMDVKAVLRITYSNQQISGGVESVS